MIKECKRDGNALTIISDKSVHVVNIGNLQDFLFDADYIYARVNNGKDDDVLAVNSDGDICFRLTGDSDFYVSYLLVHPRYGICVVASELIEGNWIDGYYTFVEGVGFSKRNQAR